MRGRPFPPEVAPGDLESPSYMQAYVPSGGKMISMAGVPNIQPYQAPDTGKKSFGSASGSRDDGVKQAAFLAGGIWLLGVFLGYDVLWPLYLALNILYTVLSIPPFSWVFGWLWTPISWIYGWVHRGHPLIEQGSGALSELRLPADQVSTFLDSYVQQYGDAALIFATHDGYPQIVSGLLFHTELGYRDLIDASDENGNTALTYAAAKGYRQCTAALLRHGADPDIANKGSSGRTPMMEAAGAGRQEIVSSLRLANATLDVVDDFGNTALHYAAYHGHLSVVHELLKGNPRKDIKNSFGHTAASYAQTNRYKAVADVLNRPTSARRQKELAVDLDSPALGRHSGKAKVERHVHGGAEDLHKRDWKDFAPTVEKLVSGITESERKALEDQIAKLKREQEEVELRSQKRIVELLEKSSSQQKALDDAERESRSAKLNNTELSLRLQELESKNHASELRIAEERQRVDCLHEDLLREKTQADHDRSRAEVAERERALHEEQSRRHEDSLRQKHDEVHEQVARLQKQAHEMSSLREDLRRREEDARHLQNQITDLQHELQLAKSRSSSSVDGGASLPLGSQPASPVLPQAPRVATSSSPQLNAVSGESATVAPVERSET